MSLREAAQQALEALDWYAECAMVSDKAADAASALRAALTEDALQRLSDANQEIEAALEQEPVAWMYVGLNSNNIMHGPHLVWKPEYMDAMSAEKGVVASPLYTHPPRREALEQTEQEVKGCDHCNHPLYAAIKCRVCGRVTEQEQEPVAWLSIDCIGERYLCFSKPLDNDPVQPLYTHPAASGED